MWAGELVSQYPLGGGASSGRVVAVDRQGSERLVLSGSGSVLGSRAYDAYGNIRTQTGASVPFDYTGNRRDAESGLIYLRARLYDPATGRLRLRGMARSPATAGVRGHGALDTFSTRLLRYPHNCTVTGYERE